jgi:hypothetical protein
MTDDKTPEATLKEDEFHPSAQDALDWLKHYQTVHMEHWLTTKEAIASTALSGNRLSEIMLSTINRLDNGDPVSDRYLLGLCWFLIRNPLGHES